MPKDCLSSSVIVDQITGTKTVGGDSGGDFQNRTNVVDGYCINWIVSSKYMFTEDVSWGQLMTV